MYAFTIDDCKDDLRLEMVRMDPRNFVVPYVDYGCRNRVEEGKMIYNVTAGVRNELMLLAAYVMLKPIMPSAGIGRSLANTGDDLDEGKYGLAAVQSYVMEPL